MGSYNEIIDLSFMIGKSMVTFSFGVSYILTGLYAGLFLAVDRTVIHRRLSFVLMIPRTLYQLDFHYRN